MIASKYTKNLRDTCYNLCISSSRPRKNNITIDEEIIKQEEQISKSKAKYDADIKRMKDLYAKKNEIKKRELLAAVEKSSKTYEKIIAFLKTEE